MGTAATRIQTLLPHVISLKTGFGLWENKEWIPSDDAGNAPRLRGGVV